MRLSQSDSLATEGLEYAEVAMACLRLTFDILKFRKKRTRLELLETGTIFDILTRYNAADLRTEGIELSS